MSKDFYSYCTVRYSRFLDKLQMDSIKKISSVFNSFFSSCHIIYMWGKHGTGKTTISKYLANFMNISCRVYHFHRFCEEAYKILSLPQYSQFFFCPCHKKKWIMIYIDEFFIDDISNLYAFSEVLLNKAPVYVLFVITSNFHPNSLYHGDIQLKLDQRSILKRIYSASHIIHVCSESNYRSEGSWAGSFFVFSASDKRSVAFFRKKISLYSLSNANENYEEKYLYWAVQWSKKSFHIKKEFFSYAFSLRDYEDFLQNKECIFISDVQSFDLDSSNVVLRFISFVDMLYFKDISCIFLSYVSPGRMYTLEKHRVSFRRTLSRIFAAHIVSF